MIKKNKNKKKYISFSKIEVLSAIFLLIGGLLLGIFLKDKIAVNFLPGQTVGEKQENYPEIKQILSLQKVRDQSPYLIKLLDRIGPEKTQEELLRSGLPFTGETHLLVHTIGKYIYEKHGASGLKMCKDYFLSACFHAFIIEDLSDNGMRGLSSTMNSCEKAGINVLSQCSHATGHGFVVWNDYDLVRALKMCDELAQKPDSNTPAFNCYDGVFMENLFSVHEGELSEKRWIDDTDPYYPCNDTRIPEKYLGGCWVNQASRMHQMYQGDLKKVAQGCDQVLNPKHQELCYNNFARQIHPMTEGQSGKAFILCTNATGEKWQNYCLNTLVGAAFSVGDKGKMPFEICHKMENVSSKNNCYNKLSGIINSYAKNQNEAIVLCKKILDVGYRKNCEEYQ